MLLDWKYVLGCLGSSLISAYLGFRLPEMTSLVCQWFMQSDGSPALVYRYVSYLAGSALISFGHQLITSVFVNRLGSQMKLLLFRSILDQEMVFFDRHSSGSILHRLHQDCKDLQLSLRNLLGNGLRHGLLLGFHAAHLVYLAPILSLSLFSTVPFLVTLGHFYGNIIRKSARQYQLLEADASGRLTEVVGNIRLVKSFHAETQELDRYDKKLDDISSNYFSYQIHQGIFQTLVGLGIQSLTLLVLMVGSRQHALNTDLTSFLMIAHQTQQAFAQLSPLYASWMKLERSYERIKEWIQLPASTKRMVHQFSESPDIDIQGIDFAFGSTVVFDDLRLHIQPGQRIILCGPSGSGKSTLFSLLECFYAPQKGRIVIDGMDVHEMDPFSLRHQIGYIPQEPVLFQDTLLNNIRYGNPGASMEKVMQVAEKSRIHDFIANLPQGYNTIIGERGSSLSGGQKQRIAIARAILKDPKVLILDEATSALDYASERQVQEALLDVFDKRTVIIIAHRLSTALVTDPNSTIVYLDRGKILEHGKHEDLLKANGKYAKLYRSNH